MPAGIGSSDVTGDIATTLNFGGRAKEGHRVLQAHYYKKLRSHQPDFKPFPSLRLLLPRICLNRLFITSQSFLCQIVVRLFLRFAHSPPFFSRSLSHGSEFYQI